MNVRKEDEIVHKKKWDYASYVLGSIVLFAVTCVTIPSAMKKATGLIYKKTMNNTKDDYNNDWGPVIEKKESNEMGDTKEKERN